MWTHLGNCRVMVAGQPNLEAVIRWAIPAKETMVGANCQLQFLSFALLFFLRHQSSAIDQIHTIQHQLSATSTLQIIIFLASLPWHKTLAKRYKTLVLFWCLLTTIQMSVDERIARAAYARDIGNDLAAITSKAHARIDSFARQYLELHEN